MTEYTKPAGTLAEKIWASSGVKTPAPDDAKIANGWVVEIPPREYFNYIENKQDQFIAHINQHGIGQWDTDTHYIAAKSYAQGSNGVIYLAKTDHSGIDPVGEAGASTSVGGVNWKLAFYLSADIYTKSETDAKYAVKASNLGDLTNTATARTNISVYSKGESDGAYAARNNNLTDLNNTGTAFDNIKLASNTGYAGVIVTASDAEAAAGVNASKAVTPAHFHLGFALSLGDNGHIVLPSWLGGVGFRWAKVTIGTGSGPTYIAAAAVTWTIPFTTQMYFGGMEWTPNLAALPESTQRGFSVVSLSGVTVFHIASAYSANYSVWGFGK